MDCDTLQGYYFSRPVAAVKIPGLLAKQWVINNHGTPCAADLRSCRNQIVSGLVTGAGDVRRTCAICHLLSLPKHVQLAEMQLDRNMFAGFSEGSSYPP